MGVRGIGVTASILSAVVVSSVTTADEAVPPICPLVLHQERVDRVERELAVDLAVSRLAAAESIFTLVDQLWENDAVERMVYLTAKRDHDVAEIELTRQRLLLMRREAEIEQYEVTCSIVDSAEPSTEKSRLLEDARRRYLQADCHRVGKELAIAEVDLAYQRKVLKSVQDRRVNKEATEQDVIRRESDMEIARKRVEHHGRRVRACIEDGRAAGRTQR